MPRVCHFTGRKTTFGNQVTHRGKAKYLGGVGTKITGITRREFKPNLQRVKITTPQGQNRTVKVCTRCLKAGIVRKAVKQAPFKLPVNLQAKTPGVKSPAKPAAKAAAIAPAKPKAAK